MGLVRSLLAALVLCAAAWPAGAADSALLIQLGPDGRYTVWHTEGATRLPEEQILALEAAARVGGGEPLETAAGPARAFDVQGTVIIEIANAKTDRRLLIDRDACGGVKVWHADGETRLTEDELTELVLTALPGGGKRVSVGKNYAKGFLTGLGVMAVIWQPVRRQP
jgi:hypothetical protein